MPVLKNSSSQTNWPLIGGIIVVIVIIIVAVVMMMGKKHPSTTEKSTGEGSGQPELPSMNQLKEKVKEFQAGNAAAFKGDLECYVDILYNNEGSLNISADIIFDILQAGGLVAANYQDGLLSSISILSKALKKDACNVYDPLDSSAKFAKATTGTVFTKAGLESVFKLNDPVGEKYTEFSFLTLVYFLSNLYKEGKEGNIISKSNNLKLLNQQLIDANAFSTTATANSGEPIVPYTGGGGGKVVTSTSTTPTTTININISSTTTPSVESTTTPETTWDNGGGGGWDETTSSTTTTTTTTKPPKTTTPKPTLAQQLQSAKFKTFLNGKIKSFIMDKLESTFPSGWQTVTPIGPVLIDIIGGVALKKVLDSAFVTIARDWLLNGAMKIPGLDTLLESDVGYQELWNKITAPSETKWSDLAKQMLSTYIHSLINGTVAGYVDNYVVAPVFNGIKSGLNSLANLIGLGSSLSSLLEPFIDEFKQKVLTIIVNLCNKLADWLIGKVVDFAGTGVQKAKEFFSKFFKSPVEAIKSLSSDSTTSSFSWSSVWASIKSAMNSAAKSLVSSICEEIGGCSTSTTGMINSAIDKYLGSNATQPPEKKETIEAYKRYIKSDPRIEYYIRNHVPKIFEAYTDINGFNKAIMSEEFSYLRPQLSNFANSREFYTIMY